MSAPIGLFEEVCIACQYREHNYCWSDCACHHCTEQRDREAKVDDDKLDEFLNDFLMTYQRVKRQYDVAEKEALSAGPFERQAKFATLRSIGSMMLAMTELIEKAGSL